MKLLVISDLHLGAGHHTDTFGWDTGEFIETVEHVISQYSIDRVVLNGDIYELYKFNYSEIEANHRDLVNYFRLRNFYYIRGNHDMINDFGETELDIENSKGQKIHIEHGHNADFFDGSAPGQAISRLVFKILKQLTRYEPLNRLYFKLVELDSQINHIPRRYSTAKYLKYALKLLTKYDMVVLAHTHKVEAHKVYYLNNKKRYLNCGSCSLGEFQGVVVDTESLKYQTIKLGSAKYQERKSELRELKKEELVS